MKTLYLYIYNIIRRAFPETRLFKLKATLLRLCGAKVGKNVRINSSARFLGNGALEIGDDVWIGAEVLITATSSANVSIGSCCDIGPQVTIITGTHEVNAGEGHVAGAGKSLPVVIGNGCWLGARSLILPGVELAARTLVAAGAVVTRSVSESNRLVAGNPAVVKKVIGG